MREREPMPERLSRADAMTQSLLKGHVMSSFERDPDLGWLVASCRACGLRMFEYSDGTIAGPTLLVECMVGRATQKDKRS